jgi:hypothetical protein
MLQFLAAAHDRVATQARDLRDALDAAPPPLERQQSGEPAPVFLIEGDQHPIDRAMVFRRAAIWMLLAELTGAPMN